MSDNSNFYAGRPASPAATAPAAPMRTPSGQGGGGGIRITPSSVGGGGAATARPQKTEVLNHAQQAAIGGPGARPTPITPPTAVGGGHMDPGPGHVPPNIGEHRGPQGGDMHPSMRDERGHPDQFRNFDHRFDRDRDRLGNTFWRTAFTDYDIDRFRPWLREDPWLYHIFGVQYYPELLTYAVPYYPTTCGPFQTGIWAIGADSRWYPIRRHQLDIIRRIELQRGIGVYEPVIIPNCGGGVYPASPYPYPAVAPYPAVSYPYVI